MKIINQIKNGIITQNPIFVLLLGMCPTLGVTTSALNGLGMGLATTFVLIASNVVVSLIKNFIPDKVRIPSFIVVIASFVTIVDLTMAAYLPTLHSQLGLFIPLIVVNCIVLGRAEAFASKNKILPSLFDGLGIGIGFTIALVTIGSIREIIGAASFFGYKFYSGGGFLVLILAPGAFFVLGYLIAAINWYRDKLTKKI